MSEFKLNRPQLDYLNSKKINTGFVAGLGSGKSYVATLKTIIKKIQNPTLTVAYYLPTYGLIRDIAFDKFPTMLAEMGITFKLNKSDKEIHIANYGKIIFRSLVMLIYLILALVFLCGWLVLPVFLLYQILFQLA